MNKKYTYSIFGIVVVLVIVWAVYAKSHKPATSPSIKLTDITQNTPQQTPNQVAPVNATSTPVSIPPVPKPAVPPSIKPSPVVNKLSYGDAIKAYPERFQFSSCQGTPISITVKKGAQIMLDNRDSVAHTFKADSQTFKISGYDYAILHTSVVGSSSVACDGRNTVTLNVAQ
jgi:hypothetical protein